MSSREPNTVTLREVAEATGVSITTVSLVLSGKADSRHIAMSTRQRVLRAARRLGYRHNALAKSLRTGRSNQVGIVGYSYPMMHHTLRMEAAARALIAEGYQVLMQNLTWQERQGGSLVKEMLSLRVEGLLIEGLGDAAEVRQLVRDLARRRFPMVRMDLTGDLPVDLVTVDRELGAYLATHHLLALGHRRIAYTIDKASPLPVVQERIQGYHRAHEEWGVKVDEGLLVPFGAEFPAYRAGYLAMQRVLQLSPRPTAVMTMDDQSAIAAIRAAFEAGLQVPEDIAVVGFVGFPEGEYCAVPLTTVAFSFEMVAREAVRMLRERMSGEVNDAEPRLVTLAPQLVVRRSCGGKPSEVTAPTG